MPRHRWGRQEAISNVFVVAKGLAIAPLCVRVDVEVVFKQGPGVEDDEGTYAEGFNLIVSRDNEDHRGVGFGVTGFGRECKEGAWDRGSCGKPFVMAAATRREAFSPLST